MQEPPISLSPYQSHSVPLPNHLSPQHRISRPLLQRLAFIRRVVTSVMQHSVLEFEGLYFAFWIPYDDIGVATFGNGALLWIQSVELRGVGRGYGHEGFEV